MDGEKTGRDQAGRFGPGQSGNPAGRPKGSRNRVSARAAELLGDASPAIMERLIKEAKKGEPVALRLAVERLVPIRAARDRAVDVQLPAIGRASDLVAAAAAVVEHAAAGEITLSEAREFMQLLEAERKLVETAELAVRIEALEAAGRPAALPPQLAGARQRVHRILSSTDPHWDGAEVKP